MFHYLYGRHLYVLYILSICQKGAPFGKSVLYRSVYVPVLLVPGTGTPRPISGNELNKKNIKNNENTKIKMMAELGS
jgi:hypothetical protein